MSAFSLFSCEFFSYRALDGQPWEGLTPPFENLASATVGLLRYSKSTTTSSHADMFGGQCKVYEDWNDVGSQRYFVVAQWSSLVAPALAILALLQIVCEWCCCRLRGSYIYMQISFFAAGIFQFCSFFVFMEDQFWYVIIRLTD